MPVLLMTLGGGLVGAYELEHAHYADYHFLSSNWMFLHIGV